MGVEILSTIGLIDQGVQTLIEVKEGSDVTIQSGGAHAYDRFKR